MVSIAKIGAVLTLDATQFEGASRTAEATTRRFGGSLDSIVSKLEAQRNAITENATVTAIYAAAEKGASAASVQYALSLERQIRQEARLREAKEQAIAVEERRQNSINSILQGLDLQIRTYGMTASQLAIYRLNEQGATADELKHALALHAKIEALQQSKTATESNAVALAVNTVNMTRNMLAAQQLAYAIEDAATVYGDQGLSGAIRASANNLVMLAMIMNPQYGIWVALASAGIQLSMAFSKMGSSAKDAADGGLKDLEERLKRIHDEIERSSKRVADVGGLKDVWEASSMKHDLKKQMEKNVKEISAIETVKVSSFPDMFDQEKRTQMRFNDPAEYDRQSRAFSKLVEEQEKFRKENVQLNLSIGEIDSRMKELAKTTSVVAQGAVKEWQSGFNDAVNKQNEQLKDTLEMWRKLANGPIGEYADKIRELDKVRGEMSPELYEKAYAALQKEYFKPSGLTEGLLDKSLKPMEKYEKSLKTLQEDLALGKINEGQYDLAAKQLASDSMGKTSKGGVASGAMGSGEAYQTIRNAIMSYQSSKTNDPTKVAMQQLAEQKKVPALLKEIKEKLQPILPGALD